MQHNTQWLLSHWIMYFTQFLKKSSRGMLEKNLALNWILLLNEMSAKSFNDW